MSYISDLTRRLLLGVLVALLTARILAPGEDPGMLQAASGPTNLLMPLLWLLAGLALAAWRLGSRNGDWHGGLVEGALLLAIAAVFVAAELAVYKHPARLIAWDWLTLFVVVCLVRQLAASPGDRQALFAVLLAGAAALSAQAVYQAASHAAASATFAQPGPFAAWLALFLPGVFAAVFVCRPGRAPVWQTVLSAVFGIVMAIAFIAAVVSVVSTPDAAPPLPEVWATTGRMIASHPLGVGPGEFSRAFPAFRPPGGDAIVADSHNFTLEIAATGGVAALLAVLAALGAFFVKAARWLRRPIGAAEPESGERTRWEFYVGGMCGLVLGFIIRQTNGDHTPDEILMEGFVACGRCLVWLAAFILFERIAWSGRVRAGALTVGVAALLLMLLWNSGVGLPSVAVPLWAAVALALNEMPQRDYRAINALALTRILPFFIVAALALYYFLNVFVPVTGCSDKIQQAVRERKAVEGKDAALAAALDRSVRAPLREAAKDDPDDARVPVLLARYTGDLWSLRPQVNPQVDPNQQLSITAVQQAQLAEKLDPEGREGYEVEHRLRMGFGRHLELDYAHSRVNFDRLPVAEAGLGPAYRLFFDETRWPHPLGAGAIQKYKEQYRKAILDNVKPTESLYPALQYMEAADALEKYVKYDPNDALLRFQLAQTLYKAWEDERCREQAAEALRLDAAAARKALNEEQRQKLVVWKDLPAVK